MCSNMASPSVSRVKNEVIASEEEKEIMRALYVTKHVPKQECDISLLEENHLKHVKVQMPVRIKKEFDGNSEMCEEALTGPHNLDEPSFANSYNPDWEVHLEKHTVTKHSPKRECDISHAEENHLKEHLPVHIKEEFNGNWEMCEEALTGPHNLDEPSFAESYDPEVHFETHTAEKRHKCSLCDKDFSRKSILRIHLEEKHGEPRYRCRICGQTSFRSSGQLRSHLEMQHEEKMFQCSQCDQTFTRPSNLRKHLEEQHGAPLLDEKMIESSCSICDKTFNFLSTLQRHMATHTEEQRHQLKSQNGGDTHKEEKKHQCSTCGKAFAKLGLLSQHRKIHIGVKKFQCVVCDKAFIHSGTLMIHMRTHTGEKRYHCNTCGKAFRTSSHLKKHLPIHTGEKNHICGLCGKAFNRPCYVKTHIKIVHLQCM